MATQEMIDAKQIQLLHIAKVQLCLDDDNYRAIISGRTKGKKQSSKDLTYFEADTVINYMVRLGFKIKSKYISREETAKRRLRRSGRCTGNVFCLATHDQLAMINALAGKIQWRVKDGFFLWMKKYIKIDRIRTDDEACAVIEGLKGLLDHQIDGDGQCNNG